MSTKSVSVNIAADPASDGLIGEISEALSRIRERAYFLFETRGDGADASLTDWLRAERDLFEIPESELCETDTSYELKMSAPGFTAGELAVVVDPNWITVGATSLGRGESAAGFQLFRRFELGTAIEADQVQARFYDEELIVIMPKAAGSREIPVPSNSAKKRIAAYA